jgi:hypothetical protein
MVQHGLQLAHKFLASNTCWLAAAAVALVLNRESVWAAAVLADS